MSQSTQPNVSALFGEMLQQGTMSQAAFSALAAPDLTAKIQAAMGTPADVVSAAEAVLLGMLLDDSGSIVYANNVQNIIDGHNLVLDAIGGAKHSGDIMAHARYLKGHVLYPWVPLGQVVRMDSGNYRPDGYTPLYDETVVMLGAVLAKSQEFANLGMPVRTITLIVTDGHDEGSRQQTPDTVRPVVEDMLMQEMHIVAAMGIDDGGYTDFRKVFGSMGIRDEWILTPKNTVKEIRQAFRTFSQSAQRASQNAASFSKTASQGLGGFQVTP